MIVEHSTERLAPIQARFDAVRAAVETVVPRVDAFTNTHRVEAYKALLKTFAATDKTIVSSSIEVCKALFPGEPILVYPMLHLPADTNEYGNWHRDGASHEQRVFWLPLTPYRYPGISYVAATGGAVSPVTSTILSKFENIGRLETPVTVRPGAVYSWPPRLLHRGNLNTSDALSSAMVIFMEPAAVPKVPALHELSTDQIAAASRALVDAVTFGDDGTAKRFAGTDVGSLSRELVDTFVSYFSLRTKVDLRALA